ncbi:RING finger protein 207-like [Branchiostoma lanceolatum]|uniref:RING finger protein 207-like n=1 Tax=Branchiostoma lanceolatum TaxID=7740 RepID=UPI0034561EAA
MSGGIFQPLGSLQDLDGPTRDPMWCYLCNERFEEPCLLDCFHAFCAQCLRGRASEGLISCPICSSPTKLAEGAALPPVDPILKFLVEVHGTEEKVFCANCDREASHTDGGPMCFCNTCSQPLCTQCKETTHSAKMFSRHDIVQLNNVRRLKETVKKCVQHGEPYIMFSLKKRDLLCIMCFRDTSVEDRAHCIDLETAYKNGCETLDQAVLSVQDLQSSVRDSIILLRALGEEVKTNAQQEQEDIKTLFEEMQEKLGERKEGLVEAVDTQYQEKSKAYKNQLNTLAALLPTLQVNISSSKTFSLTANKYDFLDLGFVLIDRLMAIVHLPHQLSPTTSSKINCDHKVEFARCLEPLLGNGLAFKSSKTNVVGSAGTSANGEGDHARSSEDGIIDSLAEKCRTTAMHLNSALSICHGKYFNANSCKVFVDESGPFAEHCRNYDTNYKILNDRVKKLKKDIQELHRDLTQRRCLTREQKVTNLMEECGQVDFTISTQYTAVEHMQSVFQKWWEECFQRVTHEQEMYQAQLKDLMRLKQETQHCTTIARQIAPFVKSIAAVKERIDPRLGEALRSEDHEGCMHAILEQINTMEPNSQQRVDAIRTAEESRDLALQSEASRPNPLEDSLIKTKCTLKPPKILPEKSRPEDSKEIISDTTTTEMQPQDSKDDQPTAVPKSEEKNKKEPVVDKKDTLLKTGALLRKDENLKISIPLICKEELAKAAAAAALKKEESKREESSKTVVQTPSKEEHNKQKTASSTTVKKEKEGTSKGDSEKTQVMSKEELAKAAASVALKMEENHKIEKEVCKA